MTTPERDPDPPLDTETPVDHIEVIRELLKEVDHNLSHIDTPPKMRTMFGMGLDGLVNMLEVME
jgi:hypothetical protein